MRLEPQKTALLTLDLQAGILGFAPEAIEILPTAIRAVEFGRSQGYRIIHVGLGFAEGHPEISQRNTMFHRVKENNLFVKGSPSAALMDGIAQPGDLQIDKQRVGAFTENQLDIVLRSSGIENLVFFGIATSGIVLSTLRRAFDLDYTSVVLKDACFDRDEEVHRVLTEKIFTAQAQVLTVDDFIAEQQ